MIPLIAGCSLTVPSRQNVTITASHPRAQISVDGAPVGEGSVTVPLKRNTSHAVMAKVGDAAGTAQIGTKISTTGMLDIAGGVLFLVPFIGIASPGFHELDTTSVYVAIPAESTATQGSEAVAGQYQAHPNSTDRSAERPSQVVHTSGEVPVPDQYQHNAYQGRSVAPSAQHEMMQRR